MHEVHKMSPREWPDNLWDDILTMRSNHWYKSTSEDNGDELLKGYSDDPYPPMLYAPILESVLVDALTEAQLKAVHLRYEQRMTYGQVAEAMGVHHSRARMVVIDALVRLQKGRNYFRLKAVPVIEVRKQKQNVSGLREENDELVQQINGLEQQIKELKQRNAKLKDRIADLTGERKRIEDAHQRVKPESSIKELYLNARAYNALERAGIETVGDLIGHTEQDLLRRPRMGKVTVSDIIGALYQCGYELKQEDDTED